MILCTSFGQVITYVAIAFVGGCVAGHFVVNSIKNLFTFNGKKPD